MSAGELARTARVSPSTASEHLAKLVDGGLLAVTVAGRHRHYRIASADVAAALETLARICPQNPVRSLRASGNAEALRFARTCYDHLAGVLGVAVLDALLRRRWLAPSDGGYGLTPAGELALRAAGVDVAGAGTRRRAFARPCLDWTQRRPHLAGALGAAVTTTILDHGWLRRGKGRGLRLTGEGRLALRDVLGLPPDLLS